MIELKKEQIISRNNNIKYEVLAISDGAYYLRSLETLNTNWFTDSEIEANFILPKEKWVPKYNEYYFCITDEIMVESSMWIEDSIDKNRLKVGNVFQTKAEAEQKVEEIKKILGE
jgi:hypothetical protein